MFLPLFAALLHFQQKQVWNTSFWVVWARACNFLVQFFYRVKQEHCSLTGLLCYFSIWVVIHWTNSFWVSSQVLYFACLAYSLKCRHSLFTLGFPMFMKGHRQLLVYFLRQYPNCPLLVWFVALCLGPFMSCNPIGCLLCFSYQQLLWSSGHLPLITNEASNAFWHILLSAMLGIFSLVSVAQRFLQFKAFWSTLSFR